MTDNKKRTVYIDVLRCIACFFVIVNHTVSTEITYYTFGVPWLSLVAYFFLSKTAVPLFIMITGSLLLRKNETYFSTFKRVLRIVIVLVIVAIIYYFAYFGVKGGVIEIIKSVVLNVFQDGISNEFWYLYLYIGILIMMPLLRKMRSNMQERDYKYLIGISLFINGVYPLLAKLIPALNTVAQFDLAIFESSIAYLFFGDYVKRYDKFTEKKNSIYAAIIILISLVVCTAITSSTYLANQEYWLWLDNIALVTTFLPSCCVFILIRNLYINISDSIVGRVFTDIGQCTFGMYLISDIVILYFKFIYRGLRGIISGIPAVIFYEVFVFVLCYLIIKMLRIIPFVKKLI